MSLISEIQAATDYYYAVKKPVDMFFKSNVLLYTLLNRGTTYSGGKKIQCNLEYGMTNAGSYGPKSELPITKREIMTAAFFTYAAYFSTLTIDMEDDLINNGEAQIVDVVAMKLHNAEKSIRHVMGSHVYAKRADSLAAGTDDNALPLLGLGDLFNTDTSVAYGEITESELPMWKAKVISTAKTMNYTFMQELRRTAGTDVTEEAKPDLYISTEILKDAFENSLQSQQRFTSGTLAKAGFDNVLFKGSPVVADFKCPDKSIYALNTRYLDVKTHTKRNFTKPEWKSPVRQPDTATANIRWVGQMVCSNRAAHALATNVSQAA